MGVQVLVAAMNQRDHSLPEKMHIQSDAIIANQCDRNAVETFLWQGHTITYLHFAERGVGLNRNNALLRATGELLLFADEDEVLTEGYPAMLEEAFQKIPRADGMIFNIDLLGDKTGHRQNTAPKRLHLFNALNYGTVRLCVKGAALMRENITFHICFGGGTVYSCGEDSLFIGEMLKKGLRLYAHPACIAAVDNRTSGWFRGYTPKYMYDKGALFAALFKRGWRLMCLQDVLRHGGLYAQGGLRPSRQLSLMHRGAHGFSALTPYAAAPEEEA